MNMRTLIIAAVGVGALCGTDVPRALSQAAPATLPHVSLPKQSGADLLTRFAATPAGRAQLASAGISAPSTSTPSTTMPAAGTAADGWPTTFDLSVDALRPALPAIQVGTKSIGAHFYTLSGINVRWDASSQLAVEVSSSNSTTTGQVQLSQLPAGSYVLAVNFHFFNGAHPAGTITYGLSLPPNTTPLGGTCTFSSADAQGNVGCLALLQVPALSYAAVLGLSFANTSAQFLGVTLSRIRP